MISIKSVTEIFQSVLLLQFCFAYFVVFIGRTVPENSLFCSHSDLLHTMTDSPTPFCVISGEQTHTLISVEFKLALFSYIILHFQVLIISSQQLHSVSHYMPGPITSCCHHSFFN